MKTINSPVLLIAGMISLFMLSCDTGTSPKPASGPDAPAGLTATAGEESVILTWGPVSGATSYNLYYKADSTVTVSGSRITGATSPCTLSSLMPGTKYAFIVTEVNASGESAPSAITTATPKHTPPGALTMTPGDGQMSLSWTNDPTATSYTVYWVQGNNVSKSSPNKVGRVTVPYTVTGLTNGRLYSFGVTEMKNSWESEFIDTGSGKPVQPEPLKVTSPFAGSTYHVGDTMHIAWEENSSSLTGIIVFLSVDGGVTNANNGNPINPDSHQIPLGVRKLDYVIPASIFGPSDLPSNNCVVTISDYVQTTITAQNAGTFNIFPDIATQTITLGGHANPVFGMAADLDNGTVMLAAAAIAAGPAVDILYTYSAVLNSPVLMNPVYIRDNSGITAFASWPNASNTLFHKVSAAFASVTTTAAIQALFNPALATSGRVACAAGDVFVVKTNQGNYVLLQMVTVSTDATGTANIKFAK